MGAGEIDARLIGRARQAGVLHDRRDASSPQAGTPPPGGALLDLAQAASYLGTSERHVRRLWQERRIAVVKVGRRVRFTRADLDAFIERNRHDALR